MTVEWSRPLPDWHVAEVRMESDEWTLDVVVGSADRETARQRMVAALAEVEAACRRARGSL